MFFQVSGVFSVSGGTFCRIEVRHFFPLKGGSRYRGLQPHAAADATVSEKEACGLMVEKDTGAYAELTRGLRAGTHKNHLEFLMSDMEV